MKHLILGLIASVASLAALAADSRMQPGLYDYTVKMDIPGMPFPMPPQKFQHCLTQADVDQGKQFESQQNTDCEVKNLKQSGNSASFDLACKDGTTGSANYTFTGDGMNGKTIMTKEGHPVTINMSASRAGPCK
jgi:hypothetical protein